MPKEEDYVNLRVRVYLGPKEREKILSWLKGETPATNKVSKRDSKKEMDGAWETVSSFPDDLYVAMDNYRLLRSERGWPVWETTQWVAVLRMTGDQAELIRAFKEATVRRWRSVYPKEARKEPEKPKNDPRMREHQASPETKIKQYRAHAAMLRREGKEDEAEKYEAAADKLERTL